MAWKDSSPINHPIHVTIHKRRPATEEVVQHSFAQLGDHLRCPIESSALCRERQKGTHPALRWLWALTGRRSSQRYAHRYARQRRWSAGQRGTVVTGVAIAVSDVRVSGVATR